MKGERSNINVLRKYLNVGGHRLGSTDLYEENIIMINSTCTIDSHSY